MMGFLNLYCRKSAKATKETPNKVETTSSFFEHTSISLRSALKVLSCSRVNVLVKQMTTLHKEIRMFIENQFDEFYNEPEAWLRAASEVLADQGIESNLETILSYLVGMTLGETSEFIKNKFKRPWSTREAKAISLLMARRAFEIRQHFLATQLR